MRIIIESESHERPLVHHRGTGAVAAPTQDTPAEVEAFDGGIAPELEGFEAPRALAEGTDGTGDAEGVEGGVARSGTGGDAIDAGPAPSTLGEPGTVSMEGDAAFAGLGPVEDVQA